MSEYPLWRQVSDYMSDNTPIQAEAEENQFDINESSYKTSHTAVRKARRFALQGLYEWLMTDHRFEQTGQGAWKENPPYDIAARTRASNAMHTVHLGYYHSMMRDIPQQIDELEALIAPHLDRAIDKIDMVEHAVLLIGAYELKHSVHIPYKVVLDEAMKLNTHFGATDAHKLINAVMDKLAAELRAVEVDADTGTGYKEKKSKSKSNKPAPEKAVSTDDKADLATDADVNDAAADNTAEPANEPKQRLGRKSIK